MPELLINGESAAVYGFRLSEAPGWADAPEQQFQTSPVAGRAGAVQLSPAREQPRRLVMRGVVEGTTVAQARERLDALKLALHASPLELVFQDFAGRAVRGKLERLVAPPVSASLVQRKLLVDVVLVCFDPYYYDTAVTEVALGVNRLPLGTAPVRPLVTISGTSNNPVLTLHDKDGVAVETLTLTVATDVGDTLTIDHDAKTIRKNGVGVMNALTTGDFFVIRPEDPRFADPGPYITTSSGAGVTSYRRAWR